MMFIEETEKELGNIDQQLAMLKRASVDAGNESLLGVASAPLQELAFDCGSGGAPNGTADLSSNDPNAIEIPQNVSPPLTNNPNCSQYLL